MHSAEPPTGAPVTPNRVGPIRKVSLAAGLIAGFLATAAGEPAYQAFHPDLQYPANFSALSTVEKTAVRSRVRFEARVADETNKAMAVFGLLGLATGVILGLAGGLAGGSGRSSLFGTVVGSVLGGLAGAGNSLALIPRFFESSNAQTGLPLLLLTHGAIFAGIGAAGGLALALSLGQPRLLIRSMIGGIIGALIGTFLSEVINFLAFPFLRMYEPVPLQTIPRLVLNLLVATGIALGAGLAAAKRRRAVATT
jgi:hypothetical protein